MKKQLFVTALSVALVTGVGTGARADDRQRLDATASTLNMIEAKHGDHDAVFARISAETGVSVEMLRKERTDTGLGFGGLLIAHELASASGKTFADVVAEFKSGKGWGQIAAEANVKLGALIRSAHRVEAKVDKDRRDMEKRVVRAKQDLDKKVAALNAAAKHGDDVVFTRISAETGVSVETLRKQKAESGLGFGELFIATEISKASGKNFSDVVAEFRAGTGWGEIAARNDLKLGKMISGAGKVNADLDRHHARASAQANAQGDLHRASGNVGVRGTVHPSVPRTPIVPLSPRR